MEPSVVLRLRRVALRVAVVISLLASTVAVFAPASSAASSAFAVTELPVQFFATSVAADPATDIVYVTLNNDHALAVIDGADNTVTAHISLGGNPQLVAVDQASDTVYAIGAVGFTPAVFVINGATNTLTTTISGPSGAEWVSAAVNPVTHMVYLTDMQGSVVVIDGNTDSVAATIPLADPVLAPNPSPEGVGVDTATNTIYVADARESQVAVIDGATNAVTGRIAMPAHSTPVGVAVDPAVGLLYTADQGTGAISVIDTATDSISTLASGLTRPNGLALDAGNGTLYATALGGSLDNLGTTYVIDTANGVIAAQIPRGGVSVAVALSGGSAYVDQSNGVGGLNDDVTIITPSTVNTMSPVVISTTASGFVVGRVSQDQLVASATPAATFSGTGLPAWLTVSPSGLLAGTPPAGSAGLYQMAVTASNGIQPTDTAVIRLEVDQAPLITSADQATFQLGVPGSFTVTATGFPGPGLSETGTLPAGLTFGVSGTSATLSGTAAAGSAGTYPITITASNGISPAYSQAFTLIVAEQLYTPVGPARVLDTRNGTGGQSGPVGAGQTISLQVAGVAGVPSSGVTAVVLNVTASDPTANSFVAAYPDGEARPFVSNLNFSRGETIANLVVVPVGADGKIDFFNDVGSVNLIADLAGYYSSSTGSSFVAAGPARVLDTRTGTGGHTGPVGPGQTISLQVTGTDGVPSSGVTAVALNVTATSPTTSSFVTVYADGSTRPLASNLNFTRGETIPNLVVVPVGADGKIDFYNSFGSVNLIGDLAGYYTSNVTGSSFAVALFAFRVLDTRNGLGGYSSPVGPGQTISLQVTGVDGVPSSGVTAVVLNVTATSTTASSFVTVYPDGHARPVASNLNFTRGETIANLVVVPVGADGKIDFYNSFGSVNLVADLAGYYVN